MENSLAPRAFASDAARKISSAGRSGCLGISAVERLDCEQKEQSSEQAPDLALTMEQRRMASPLKRRRTDSVTSSRRQRASSGSDSTARASAASIPSPDKACARIFSRNGSMATLKLYSLVNDTSSNSMD